MTFSHSSRRDVAVTLLTVTCVYRSCDSGTEIEVEERQLIPPHTSME